MLKGVVEATVNELSALDLEYLNDVGRLSLHLQSGAGLAPKPRPGFTAPAQSRRMGLRTFSVAEALGTEGQASMPVGLYSDGSHFGQVCWRRVRVCTHGVWRVACGVRHVG